MTVLRRYMGDRRALNGTFPLTAQTLIDLFANRTAANVDINEQRALMVPAVYRAVSLIAGVAAGLPLKTYRNTAGERDEVRMMLLEQPYPNVTPFQFWELVYTDLLLWSNCYVYKARNDLGDVARLLRLPPWQVSVFQDEQTTLNPSGKYFRINNGTQDRYGPADIMHIPMLGIDGLTGLNRVGLGREAIGVAIAAEQTAGRMFGDGLLFTGILTSDQDLTQDAAETLGARFRKAIVSRGPAAKIPVLGRGTRFDKVSMDATEGQFLESRQFQVLEVARFWGIDPALLMDPSAVMNYGEPQMQRFISFTMDPYLVRVEQAAGLHLTPRGQFCEYTRAAFLRADTKTRYETYARAVQFGILTRNEVRQLENFPALDGLDEPLTPANLGGDANSQPESGVTPAPDAAPVGAGQ